MTIRTSPREARSRTKAGPPNKARRSRVTAYVVALLGFASFAASLVGATFLGEPPVLAVFFGGAGLILMSPLLPSLPRKKIARLLEKVLADETGGPRK